MTEDELIELENSIDDVFRIAMDLYNVMETKDIHSDLVQAVSLLDELILSANITKDEIEDALELMNEEE